MSEQDQRQGKAHNQLSSISGDEATGDHAALTVSDLNNAVAEATAASATISDARRERLRRSRYARGVRDE